MSDYDYDFFTIGGGSAGVRAARFAANFGAKVGIAEEGAFGGTCVNVGCIPKKLFAYAAHYSAEFEGAKGYGWRLGSASFDWQQLLANKNREIARLNGVYERLLSNAGVQIHRGRARLLDAHTVVVDGKQVRSRYILIATGGWPMLPDVLGIEHAITSNQAFHLLHLPQRAVIVGGGYIAVEFASIFNGLGVATTVVYRGDHLIKEFDHDLGKFLSEQMAQRGVQFRFGCNIVRIEKDAQGLRCHLDDGGVFEADLVMYATGRNPNTANMGLEEVGVKTSAKGALLVNERFQTNIDSIYAAGDCVARMLLTPIALSEGMVIADHLFNRGARSIDYDNVPTAIFSDPNVATVGLSEARARAKYRDVDIYRSQFTALKHQAHRVRVWVLFKTESARKPRRYWVGKDCAEAKTWHD